MTTEKLFAPVTFETANDAQRPILEGIQKNMGFVPNLMATMTVSPTLIKGYLAMNGAFDQGTFTRAERQLIELAASAANECHYCVAAHGTILKKMLKVDADVVDAVKSGDVPPDAKVAALVATATEIVLERGHLSDTTRDQFFAAGYAPDQLLELLLGIGLKTITNYMDHFNPVELDEAFSAEL